MLIIVNNLMFKIVIRVLLIVNTQSIISGIKWHVMFKIKPLID